MDSFLQLNHLKALTINACRLRHSNKAVTATYVVAKTALLENLDLSVRFLLAMFDAIFIVNVTVILPENLVNSK